MSGDNALTDVLRTSVSCDNSVMVFHLDVLTIPLNCDNTIMANLSQIFLEPYSE